MCPPFPDSVHLASDRTAVLLIAHGSRERRPTTTCTSSPRLGGPASIPSSWPASSSWPSPTSRPAASRCVDSGHAGADGPLFPLRRASTSAAISPRPGTFSRHPGVEFRLGPPLGPHPLLDSLVAARILELETRQSSGDSLLGGGRTYRWSICSRRPASPCRG